MKIKRSKGQQWTTMQHSH